MSSSIETTFGRRGMEEEKAKLYEITANSSRPGIQGLVPIYK